MCRTANPACDTRPADRCAARAAGWRGATTWRAIVLAASLLATLHIGCDGKSPAPPAATPSSKQRSKMLTIGGVAPPRGALPPPLLRFYEVSRPSGLDWIYKNGVEADRCAMVETLGGGMAWLDYDGDGLLDAFYTGGGVIEADFTPRGHASALFRNRGDARFSAVSGPAGIDVALHYSHAAVAGDYDADGFPDLLVTGYGGLALWHNEGDGTFSERHMDAGLLDSGWSSSAAWGDFNGDGHLDLFVLHYVNWSPQNHPLCEVSDTKRREICPPRMFDGTKNSLYLSQADGRFVDATLAAGLSQIGKGLGVVAGDLDLDGDLDLYVGNDTVENFLLINDGSAHFQERGLEAGVAMNDEGLPDGSMGVDIHDYNNDGRPDLWAANYEREAFAVYRNAGEGQFLHVSQATGITALGGLFVGWGTSFSDLDCDGDEDIVVACGHVMKYPNGAPLRQNQLLLENLGGRFRRVVFEAKDYFEQTWEARGVAVADIDNDGDLDVGITHVNERSALLVNETQKVGGWLGVRLIGRMSNRDAIGARLELSSNLGEQLRLVKGAGSYLSQSDYRVFWGLPQGASDLKLTVYWPSGVVQKFFPEPHEWQIVIEPNRESVP